jgi:hypothetical protein
LAKFDLRQYARDGARARAEELKAELAKIYRLFPDLRGDGTRGGRRATGSARRPRRRKVMTAAQRKAVSLRMKKYWASRRKVQ